MHRRLYHYRGFEIAVQPALVSGATMLAPAFDFDFDFVRYRCTVEIRKPDSGLQPDVFPVERNGGQPFVDAFDAVPHGCHAAERRIDSHCARSSHEHDLVDAIC